MPCDSIRQTSIDLTSIGRIDPANLVKALKALGREDVSLQADGKTILGYGVKYQNGQLELTGRASYIKLDQVKQSYAAETVKATAKKYGWQLKQTAPYQYEVTKTSY